MSHNDRIIGPEHHVVFFVVCDQMSSKESGHVLQVDAPSKGRAFVLGSIRHNDGLRCTRGKGQQVGISSFLLPHVQMVDFT